MVSSKAQKDRSKSCHRRSWIQHLCNVPHMTAVSLFSQRMSWNKGLRLFSLSLWLIGILILITPTYFSRMSIFHLNRLKRPPFARFAFPLAPPLMLSEPGKVRSPRKSVRNIYCNHKKQRKSVKNHIIVKFSIVGKRKKMSLQMEKDSLLTYCNLNNIRCSFLQRVTANSFSIRVLLMRALLSTSVPSSDSPFA